MRSLLIVTAIFALGACQKAEAPPAEEAAPTEAGAPAAAGGGTPGTYDVTRADGTKFVSTLNADGTFQRDFGDRVEKGTWVAKGDQTCFDLEGDAPESCSTRGPAAADGSFESTNPDTGVAKVVPRL